MADDSVNGVSVVLNNTRIPMVKPGDECRCCESLRQDLKRAILILETATEIIRILRKEMFSDASKVMNSSKGSES
jgi:hypothetical protein